MRHGTMCRIADFGVFITGPAGIGKSELALNLLDRGHALIADDAVLFDAVNAKVISRCPEKTKNLLCLFGVGLINITQCFGESAVVDSAELNIIIELCESLPKNQNRDLLKPISESFNLLGVNFPKILFPNKAYGNPALVLEATLNMYCK